MRLKLTLILLCQMLFYKGFRSFCFVTLRTEMADVL